MARPIAADHDEKRRAILNAAAEVIAREGYGRASIAQIARAAGVSKAALYHYWPGKDAILFDILDAHLKGLRDRICTMEPVERDPAAQLRQIVREILLAYEGRDAEHEVQLNALAALPEERQEILKGYQRELVAAVRDRIAALAPEGAEPRRLRAVAMSVFAMLNWFYKWNRKADRAAREAYADLVADLTLKGLDGVFAKDRA